MYLKSLTLRGFKSFASATTLNFEPGITCVVGPNGSGKSNVVDALSWVMGEQGAKSLRGGKMEDVIFAGTSGRAPLGRAEVVLTIDNSDGALPIDYAEVTISRTMFRNGGSEYAINSQHARLLDVQDLLSDSGIGREMHVIVGQGQLDSILQATPEGRRGFIEEAAGVLKHRKRKEKALRKLEACEGNLNRLSDLITEIRRQLKPLGRQAEVARKAAVIQAEVRDARARLLADDLVQATLALESDLADEQAMRHRRLALEDALDQARQTEIEAEEAVRQGVPRLTSGAGDLVFAGRAAGAGRAPPCPSPGSGCATPTTIPASCASAGTPTSSIARPMRSAPRNASCPARSPRRRRRWPRPVPRTRPSEEAAPGRGGPAGRAGPGRGRPAGGSGPADRAGQLAAQPGRGGRGRDRPADRCPASRPPSAPSRPPGRSPRWRPRSPVWTPASSAWTPSTRRRSQTLDALDAQLAELRRRGAGRRPGARRRWPLGSRRCTSD